MVYVLLLAAVLLGIAWRKEALYVALTVAAILLVLALVGVRGLC